VVGGLLLIPIIFLAADEALHRVLFDLLNLSCWGS